MDNLLPSSFFATTFYYVKDDQWLKSLNKICDKYIKENAPFWKEKIDARNKRIKKDIKDFGYVHHSDSMIGDPGMKNFSKHIKQTAWNILDSQGYDLTNYEIKFNDLWVQDFAKHGGGFHDTHVHSNSHISGFYFLKCSPNTSVPYLHDPRHGKYMMDLPEKNESFIGPSTKKINYAVTPGSLLFFNSFVPHQFPVDIGVDPFRFIHFNLQAVFKLSG
jgi:uncharacterized protein (TIGR02466 family)|tara:strand:- start:89 stop:742 length:654 start_codon:yes stop_codon:yes gene_type:complete